MTVGNCHLTAASEAAEESYLMISPRMTRRPGMSLLAGGRMETLPAPRRGHVGGGLSRSSGSRGGHGQGPHSEIKETCGRLLSCDHRSSVGAKLGAGEVW